MSYLYWTIMRFRLMYTSIYPTKQTNNIGLTYCKLRVGGKPLQFAYIPSRIHLEYNLQVGCDLFHSHMMLTIYSSGLPISFCYHLPLQFHTTKSWVQKHLSQVTADPNGADRRAFQPIQYSLANNMSADTRSSAAKLPKETLHIWPRMHI